MTQNRFYSSNAVKTTLTAGVSAGATTLPVAATTGFPVSLPYTLILERDTANEEVVTVTAVAGLNLTVTRGADGTAGVTHSIGATVEHGVSARDFNEPQAHIAASSGVHGLTGSVVGTSDVQTLTGKTLAPATVNDVPLTVTVLPGQANDMAEMFDAAGVQQVRVASTGGVVLGPGVGLSPALPGVAGLALIGRVTNNLMLYLRKIVGLTSDMVRLDDESGNAMLAIDKNGHLAGRGTAPAVAAGANNGATPPAPGITAGASDHGGQINFGSGTGPTAGAQVTVTFARAYAATPKVVVCAQNAATYNLGLQVGSITTTGFVISATSAPTASQPNSTYIVQFIAIG